MRKRYSVTGTQPVLDHHPGETFEAEIPTEQERFLLAIGALSIVGGAKKPARGKRDADRR